VRALRPVEADDTDASAIVPPAVVPQTDADEQSA
jgi:hypothetical protein